MNLTSRRHSGQGPIPSKYGALGNVQGLDNVMKRLNQEIKGIKERSVQGLIESQIIIRRDMDNTSPRIPVDLGNLRSSYFAVATGGKLEQENPNFTGENAGKLNSGHRGVVGYATALIEVFKSRGAALVMGFSAFYAFIVHENVGAHFKRPGSGAKFFEASIKRNAGKVLTTIRKFGRVE